MNRKYFFQTKALLYLWNPDEHHFANKTANTGGNGTFREKVLRINDFQGCPFKPDYLLYR